MKTEKELFIVKSQGKSRWSNSGSDKWVWFKLLEGSDQGISLRIPLYDERISEQVQETLHSLNNKDVIKAKLQRQSAEEPWIPVLIQKQEE
jgi:hypothetical protein